MRRADKRHGAELNIGSLVPRCGYADCRLGDNALRSAETFWIATPASPGICRSVYAGADHALLGRGRRLIATVCKLTFRR